MEPLGLNELREKFLAFFESKGHLRMPSFPLVPHNDKSLLLINSGMAPLKPFFTGQEIPPCKRVTTSQKCIRTGDIDNVGKTARHGTFFEMLGNFSFGDYFKEESISWSWEFVTEVLQIPVDKLYISVYQDDDEAYDLWHNKIGIPHERIFRMGKEDNFWEVGLGPCGPCSEIYFDKGAQYGCASPNCTVGCDCDRYMEFWNLVFTQFNKEEDGSYSKLPNPNIDTGMGLERLAAMMQDVASIFDIDTVKAIRDAICTVAGISYAQNAVHDVSIRVVTDHVRSMTFMTADGILPSNEGRGYVLRRLLRRAVRHGRLLGIQEPFLPGIVHVAMELSKGAYPQLDEKRDYIIKVIRVEEERFHETLDQGMEILKEYIQQLRQKGGTVLPGEQAFRLYDTYGFPLEQTQEILAEEGLTLDEERFRKEMEQQRKRARSAREDSTFMGAEETVFNQLDPALVTNFAGYNVNELPKATVIGLVANGALAQSARKGDEVAILLDETPFYAEGGGQAGDKGKITVKGLQAACVEVADCIKTAGDKCVHIGTVTEGSISLNDSVSVSIDAHLRLQTARNHTATHLLQKALRDVLGNHVEQTGSYVASDRLRFDLTHFAPITADELAGIEAIVNEKVLEALPVDIREMSMAEARGKGAMALFGEKYGDLVRVVDINGYSVELCGGCHVDNSAAIGPFKILSENGVAAGVRRIEALTGSGALEYYRQMEIKIKTAAALLKTSPDQLVTQLTSVINQSRDLSKEVEKLRSKMATGIVDEILQAKAEVKGHNLVTSIVNGMEVDVMRELGDKLKNKLKTGIVVLAGEYDGKVNMVVMLTDDAVKAGAHAGNIIKDAIGVLGGRGGGRPNMAQAGAAAGTPTDIEKALNKARETAEQQLS